MPRSSRFALLVLFLSGMAQAAEYFEIRAVDAKTSAPLSGVRLETTSHLTYVTDSSGRIAFYEPGLMDTRVYFHVFRPGYEVPADYFGYHGVAFDVREGGVGTVTLQPAAVDGSLPPVDNEATLLLDAGVPDRARLFALRFVDEKTQRGVPLVQVDEGGKTWVSDSNGYVAYHRPGRMGVSVTFLVRSHGYRLSAANGEGAAPLTLQVTEGGEATVSLVRDNVAERLYRVTGLGIYADSSRLGEAVPLQRPVENGLVMGQDSVLTAVHRGTVRWIWGDTNRPAYPLGNFHASGAVSALPDAGGLPPEVGVDLHYFTDAAGWSRPMAPPSTVPGDGITWLDALASVPVADGGPPELYVVYSKVLSLTEESEAGVAVYDEEADLFRTVAAFPADQPHRPRGGAVFAGAADAGYLYFDQGLRLPATAEGYRAMAAYEGYSPFLPGATREAQRDAEGRLELRWRPGVAAAGKEDVDAWRLSASELLTGHERDLVTGTSVLSHGTTTAYNAHRDRYVRIFTQSYGGPSLLGETWYAEADTPLGPFVWARKVLSHQAYSFYNPRLHPFFDEEGGRRIYFEATYTTSFSGNKEPTPKYDYNQVMYRLDLADERLTVPVPVYVLPDGTLGGRPALRPWHGDLPIAFFSPDRPGPGLEPVGYNGARCEPGARVVRGPDVKEVLFHAPAPGASVEGESTELGAYRELFGSTGEIIYAVDWAAPTGWTRESAIARVRPSPVTVAAPLSDFLPRLTAHAGDDLCVPAEGGRVQVTLAGTRSAHADGQTLSFHWDWTEGGVAQGATGAAPTVTLPEGLTLVGLTVTAEDGTARSDQLLVRVGEGVQPPGGCGCGSAGGSGAALLLALLAFLPLAARRHFAVG